MDLRFYFSVDENRIGWNMTKQRIKPLLPSLRERKRYIVFEIISKSPITDAKLVSKAIWAGCLSFLGELECSKAGLMTLDNKYKSEAQKGIVRVNHKYVDKVKASMTLIQNIDNTEVIMRPIGVSGIIKKAVGKYLAA